MLKVGTIMTTIAATCPLVEIDMEASVIEAASKRVRVALSDSSKAALCAVCCFYLHRAQKVAKGLRSKLSNATVRTAEDRQVMREIAYELNQALHALDQASEQANRLGVAHWPILGAMLVRKLDDLATVVEDMSETAALAASETFARTVRRDFHAAIEAHQHTRSA